MTGVKNVKQFIINALLLVGFMFSFTGLLVAEPIMRVDYIGMNPLVGKKPSKDTIDHISLFEYFTWQVRAVQKDRKILTFTSSRPDTLSYITPDTVYYSTSFIAGPAILHRLIALNYDVGGSVAITLNGAPLLFTGVFATDRKSKLGKLFHNDGDYVQFEMSDSVQNMQITYLVGEKENGIDLGLKLYESKVAEAKKQQHIIVVNEAYALGFYYLAFGILFLILFLFFKEKTENLYFSLFCFSVSLGFLWNNTNIQSLFMGDWVWIILSFECLSIFFAKVLRNKEKSKIPLIAVILIFSILSLPVIKNNIQQGLNARFIVTVSVLALVTCYAFISSVYFLIRGIGRKHWEAKAIVYIFGSSLVLFFVLPIVISAVNSYNRKNNSFEISVRDVLSDIGFCIYPLSAAIVLGRRNGLNQKQLMEQITSIEQLSAENLEREKEKKQLLKDQNTELERKVEERTSEVLQQKKEIEIKNKAITDNVIYAQRIQSAILPDIKLIYKTLAQSFILYLPKDIVSGDFYVFSEKNDKVLMIAGDCTGHGVSGAFMSMIGSSLLNQIINEKGITQPALILNQLNLAVIDSLKQGENDTHDGMDVSICAFDLRNNTLEFAGANRPLWLVRDNELIVVSPDKSPIGGLQMARDRTFTNHTIPFFKNDTIYIFTDGYADQFGGEKGKKMMTAHFKSILTSIQHLNMQEQEVYLKTFFDQWKGGNEQVDDVLVIGVRL